MHFIMMPFLGLVAAALQLAASAALFVFITDHTTLFGATECVDHWHTLFDMTEAKAARGLRAARREVDQWRGLTEVARREVGQWHALFNMTEVLEARVIRQQAFWACMCECTPSRYAAVSGREHAAPRNWSGWA